MWVRIFIIIYLDQVVERLNNDNLIEVKFMQVLMTGGGL
jgi:hypothetical protein